MGSLLATHDVNPGFEINWIAETASFYYFLKPRKYPQTKLKNPQTFHPSLSCVFICWVVKSAFPSLLWVAMLNKVRNPGKEAAGAKTAGWPAPPTTTATHTPCSPASPGLPRPPHCLGCSPDKQRRLDQQQAPALLGLWGKCFLELRDLLWEPPVPPGLLPGLGLLAQGPLHSSQEAGGREWGGARERLRGLWSVWGCTNSNPSL